MLCLQFAPKSPKSLVTDGDAVDILCVPHSTTTAAPTTAAAGIV